MLKLMNIFFGTFLLALFNTYNVYAIPWQKLDVSCGSSDTYFNSVAIPSPSAIYVVGGGPIIGGPGIICKSSDGGDNWISQTIPTTDPPLYLYAIDCIDNLRCFAAGSGGHILKTFDGGAMWEMVTLTDSRDLLPGPDPMPTFWGIHVVNRYGPLHIIAVGDMGNIWRSTNSGASWSILDAPGIPARFLTNLTEVYFPRADWPGSATGYISGFDRTLLKSTNGGGSWSLVELDPADSMVGSLSNVYALNPSKVWISGTVDIRRSDNGGDTWVPSVIISPGPPNIPFGDNYFFDESIGFAIGGMGGGVIRKSLDGGATWPNFFPGVTRAEDLSVEDQRILEEISVHNSSGALVSSVPNLADINCNSNFCLIVGNDKTILRRDQTRVDLVPSDGWSLACANTSRYLHIIAGVRNNGDGIARGPFQVRLESLDAAGNPISGTSRVYTMDRDVGPNEFVVLNTIDLSSADLYNLFNPSAASELRMRMTVDSNVTAERPNGDVAENPEGGEANNVRSQSTPCGVASAPATGGGGLGGEKKPKKKKEPEKKPKKWKP